MKGITLCIVVLFLGLSQAQFSPDSHECATEATQLYTAKPYISSPNCGLILRYQKVMYNCAFKLATLIDANDAKKEVYKVDLESMYSLATLLSTEYGVCLSFATSDSDGLFGLGLSNIPL